MKRLFIAVSIELSEQFQALTQQLKYELRNDEIVWVKEELQHLTLRFLGQTPETEIKSVFHALSITVNETQSFELQLDKIGVFGSKYAPATLWYGFSEFSLFKNLFEKLENKLLQTGVQGNCGNFVPHITVGRIKKTDNKKRFWETITKRQPLFSQTVPVLQLKLIQSKLTGEGPIYKTLYSFDFKK